MHDHPDQRSSERSGDESVDLQQELERLRTLVAGYERQAQDLLMARRELAQARAEQERLAEQLSALRAGTQPPAAPVGMPGQQHGRRAFSLRAWLSPSARQMQRDVQLIYQSGLFDADWYRSEYPDVANTQLDPAEHYLLHGAFEGRNPGPQFNTQQYLFENPGLVDSRENPLLHYLHARGPAVPR